MRWRRWPAVVSALGLGLALSACVSKSEMKTFVMDGYTATEGGRTINYPGLNPFLRKLSSAVCQLESKATLSSPLDEVKRVCPSGGEETPPPKYPPR